MPAYNFYVLIKLQNRGPNRRALTVTLNKYSSTTSFRGQTLYTGSGVNAGPGYDTTDKKKLLSRSTYTKIKCINFNYLLYMNI